MAEVLSAVEYEQCEVLAELGRGTFGVVKCVSLTQHHPRYGQLLAMKIYNRQANHHRAQRILAEKDILLNKFRGCYISMICIDPLISPHIKHSHVRAL